MTPGFRFDSCLPDETQPRIGWLCSYTPEELIMAAGFTPVRLSSSERPAAGAEAYLSPNLCPYVRSIINKAVSGSYADLRGVFFALSCDAMRRLADAWELFAGGRFMFRLDVPRRVDEFAERFFSEQLEGMVSALESEAGRRISDDDIFNAIETLNENRRLVRRLSRLRAAAGTLLNGVQFHRIARAAMSSDKVRFNMEARRFIAELESGGEQNGVSSDRPRVLLSGCVVDAPGLVSMIEDSGAEVVAEDHCSALRHFDSDVEDSPEPVRALARRYLRRAGCARMTGAAVRITRLLKLINDYRVKGVIFHTLKFCDLVQSDFPHARERLLEAGIPLLHVERDYTASSSGQLRTRLEAFVEMLTAGEERSGR